MTELAQRTRDLLIVFASLPLLLPLIGLLALVVAIEARRMPFFLQSRVGRRGEHFTIIKLETFREHPIEFSRAEEIARDDPRLTSLGGFLRRYKLDELPQVFNVLRGEMSLVGPRPDLPSQALDYDATARRRLQVRPGLTGLVQVSGNAALCWSERFAVDAWYVGNRSILLDFRILIATPLAVLTGELPGADPLGMRHLWISDRARRHPK